MNDDKIGVIHQRLFQSDIPEHEHGIWQIALTGTTASIQASWQTATGRKKSKYLLGNQIVIIPANQPHTAQWQTEADIICFFVPPRFATQSLQEALRTGSIELVEQYGIHDPLIQQLGNAICTELQMMPAIEPLYLESVATILAVHLVRHYSTGDGSLHEPAIKLPHSKLGQVIEYIHTHLGQDLTLTELAAVMHLSPHYFARAFKRAVGVPPHQYVRHCRIEAAKQLLKQRRCTIAAIAQELGFRSPSHFSEVFRKQTGVVPTAYRRQC